MDKSLPARKVLFTCPSSTITIGKQRARRYNTAAFASERLIYMYLLAIFFQMSSRIKVFCILAVAYEIYPETSTAEVSTIFHYAIPKFTGQESKWNYEPYRPSHHHLSQVNTSLQTTRKLNVNCVPVNQPPNFVYNIQ